MTDARQNASQRTEPKGGAQVPVKVKDRRSTSVPSTPVRHPASGKYRQKQGGRRGR
jgi:hypothetical protein